MTKSLRLIDTTIHELTAAQALEMLLIMFKESTKEPVTVMTVRGDNGDMMNRIRTELSRMRKGQEQAVGRAVHFGFSVEGPIPLSIGGNLREAYAVTYHITQAQQMKNLAYTFSLEAING